MPKTGRNEIKVDKPRSGRIRVKTVKADAIAQTPEKGRATKKSKKTISEPENESGEESRQVDEFEGNQNHNTDRLTSSGNDTPEEGEVEGEYTSETNAERGENRNNENEYVKPGTEWSAGDFGDSDDEDHNPKKYGFSQFSATKSTSKASKKGREVRLVSDREVVALKSIDNVSVKKFKTFILHLKQSQMEYKRSTFIESEVQAQINWIFEANGELADDEKQFEWVDEWSDEKFFSTLLKYCTSDTKVNVLVEDKLRALTFVANPMDPLLMMPFASKVREIYMDIPAENLSEYREKELIKILMSTIEKAKPCGQRFGQLLRVDGLPNTVQLLLSALIKHAYDLKKHFDAVTACNYIVTHHPLYTSDQYRQTGSSHGGTNHHKQGSASSHSGRTGATSTQAQTKWCRGCGRAKHVVEHCLLKKHPDFNRTDSDWRYSEKGKAFWSKGKYKELPWDKLLSGATWKDAPPKPQKAAATETAGTSNQTGTKRAHNGEERIDYDDFNLCYARYSTVATMHTFSIDDNVYDYTIPSAIVKNQNVLDIYALLDSGALQRNYVSKTTAEWLSRQQPTSCSAKGKCECNNMSNGIKLSKNEKERGNNLSSTSATAEESHNDFVCTGINKLCSRSLGKVTFDFVIFNEVTKVNETLCSLEAIIIDTPYDVIIGRPTIIKYDLSRKIYSFFSEYKRYKRLSGVDASSGGVIAPAVNLYADTRMITSQLSMLNVNIKKKSELIDYEDDDDGIDYKVDEVPWDIDPNRTVEPKPLVYGNEQFKAQLTELCKEYDDIFSINLRPEPADLPPMEIKLKNGDDSQWKSNSNRGPPRMQTKAKEYEVLRQINKMISNNVITPSQASEYSQVLLTPKPNDKWRFCVDFRRLNEICESMGWPIPNVMTMLQRLGQQKPKFFGVMDLTSGYHQAPMSVISQILTAFITFMGVFAWLRVPMGLKGAPSYFQSMMATVVLVGLMYIICEAYLDDIIVHAQTEPEFLSRLRQVFDRFRKHRLTLNPEKCRFGLPEVEYVGHIINESGLSFSKEKINEVLDFPKPRNAKGLRSFLGLANYFREHIKNHSLIVHPLQEMIVNYDKRKVLTWTDEGIVAFEQIKKEIENCPTLFFMDDTSPVYLHTDASDYGIGGYVFQIVNNVERPAAFFSKSLSRERLRWSVPEKEAYAIVYGFSKFEYLLRDRYFILRTDHKNLTYINMEGSPKVKRWKLAIQEYDFDIEHIAGVDNIAADAFSRLCPLSSEEMLCTMSEFRIPKDKYKIIATVHNSNAGHHGVERTLAKLQAQNNTWLYMREHVKRFVRKCPCCQKMSHIKVPIHTHPFTTSRYEPMECINIDTIGPLPSDQFGNTYILVVICCFTRFVELYAINDTTAQPAARSLLAHIGRYGAPAQLRSDRGTQFVNNVIKELLQLVGTEHLLTLAYSKEENAIVERANKEVLRHLRAILYNKNIVDDWSVSLPLVQRIMNASVHESIGVSPAQLLFGNAITLDRGILLPHNIVDNHNSVKLSDWADKMLSKQATLLQIAQTTQQKRDAYHIATYSPQRTEFPLNSYVLVSYHNRPTSKFHSNLRGPLRVVNFNKSMYTLQNLVTNKNEDVHITQLKPFLYDPEVTNPRDVANKDYNAWDVESILNHKGDKKDKTHMTFEVKWSGVDQTTWEPWSNLKGNLALHDYLKSHKMKSLIPKSYTVDGDETNSEK